MQIIFLPPTHINPATAMATKRPAESDLSEAADKKSRSMSSDAVHHATAARTSSSASTSEPAPTLSEVPYRHTSAGGIISTLARSISSPFPVYDMQEVTVTSSNYEAYFKHLRMDLINAVFPDSAVDPPNIISADDFVIVCRYLLKSRVDTVYSSVSGRRPTHRIAIPRDFAVPKALSDLINGIGVYTICAGAATVLPTPESAPQDANSSVSAQCTFARMTSFSRLVTAAHVRNFINIGYLSNVTNGTAWWLLSARTPATPDTVASEQTVVQVYSSFKEWTPADAIYCAIVQNHFNGKIGDLEPNKWSTDIIRGIPAIRSAYDIGA